MLEQLLNYIRTQKLWEPPGKILAGVSGGVDSVVLAHLLHEAGIPFAIAHCNFTLRGRESEEDRKFVEALGGQLGVPVHVRRFETKKYAETHGISVQMAARDLRRAWFEALAEEGGYEKIALAHHLNDSLETVIFNLTKGTGIAGLKGIPPKQGRYIRPLLFATREMIEKYAVAHDIAWREDSSNRSVKYHRNLIRHEVIPALKKINPNLEETFRLSMEKMTAAAGIFSEVVHEYKAKLQEPAEGGFKINKEKLLSAHEFQIILYELLKPLGFNYTQTGNIAGAVEGRPGKVFDAPSHQLVIDRGYLYVTQKRTRQIDEISIESNMESVSTGLGQLTFQKLSAKSFVMDKDSNTALLDYDKLEFPLLLRRWKKGDKFMPLGMKGKKKVSDFMIDEKIPLNLKNQVMVLQSGKNLAWVVGYRIDDRYKITDETRWIYKIRNIVKR